MACLDDANFFPENPMPSNRDESEIQGLAAVVTEEEAEFDQPDLDDSAGEAEAEPVQAPPPRKARGPLPVQPPARVAPVHPDIGNIVNISCRAQRPCGGRQAKIVNVFRNGDFGGTSRRYKCTTCKQPFSITV
jgi:hypothetical protein